MTMTRSHRALLGAALLLAPIGAGGCMSFDGLDQKVELKTNVDDWRDQVIYQVMIDPVSYTHLTLPTIYSV